MRVFNLDLHLHSVLSPCGDLEMGLGDIARRAMEIGLDGLALTDHNSCANVRGLLDAADALNTPLWVIPGCEVQTEEDIHVVALFEGVDAAMDFQDWLFERLGPVMNDPDVFGYQLVVDKDGNILDQVDKLLVQGVSADVDRVLQEIRARDGISILSHVDRPSFSYTAVLGPVPEDLDVDGIEISSRASEEQVRQLMASLPAGRFPFIRSSDAHNLSQMSIERCTKFLLEKPSFDELRLAFRGEGGRGIAEPWPFPLSLLAGE
ncbi:MAG: PHP domain-containing protein [Thermanaerothrix sp.]|nr:PHP domain-containing protein [Thermanaerothrix sp.]